jgi:hypothetical protein
MSNAAVYFHVLTELGVSLFLAAWLDKAFRSEARPVFGLLFSTGIFLAIFLMFYLIIADCEVSQLWDAWSVLYGSEREACFPRLRSRLALATVIAGVYACPMAIALTLLRRFKRRSSQLRARR